MSDSSHVYSFIPIIFVGRAGRASVASMLQTFWLEVLLKYLPLLHLMFAHQTHQTQNPSAVPNSLSIIRFDFASHIHTQIDDSFVPINLIKKKCHLVIKHGNGRFPIYTWIFQL